MKPVQRNILIGVLLLISAGQAFAYPPDNAATLYYKAFILMKEPNDTEKKMLWQFCDGNIVSNEQIKFCVESNRHAIKEVVAASRIKNCDWGLDFSEGFATLLPHLTPSRRMAYILAAEAKILAQKDDYETALDRCITIYNLGIHVGNDTIISCLVSRAICNIANKTIVDTLPQIAVNYEMLAELRSQLVDVSGRLPSMKVAIGNEAKCWNGSIKNDDILEMIHNSGLPAEEVKKLEVATKEYGAKEFFIKMGKYYQGILNKMQIAYDLPFTDANQAFDNLYKEVENDAKDKPEAVINKSQIAEIIPILTHDTRGKTHLNAVLAGIDIYLIRAKTGKLPDEMPAGLPKDLFSGKDFIYEKTGAGFTLKCQGKDNVWNVIHQYEFKVKK
jgi:hypothetical protein